MKQTAVYPGTFDPVTNGHIDLIVRAATIFSEVIVAVADNRTKKPFFSLATRIELLQGALPILPNVRIHGFHSLLVDFVKAQNAQVILRGLRAVNDFETLFLTPSEEVLFISSSLVREIAALSGDISQFVPSNVTQAYKDRAKL
jgi:pantetheine-phosphate adenylyltransferase